MEDIEIKINEVIKKYREKLNEAKRKLVVAA